MSLYLVNPFLSASNTANISLDELKAYYTFGDSGDQLNHASAVGSTDAIASSTIELFGNTTSGASGHVSGVDSIDFPNYDVHGNYATSSNPASDYDFMVTDDSNTIWTACFWMRNTGFTAPIYQTADIWGFNGNGASNDIQFRYKNNDRFTLWFAGNEYTGFTLTMTDNDWHFYMVSWDEPNGTIRFSIDNVMETSTGITTSNTSSPPDALRFGDVSGNEFEGQIQLFILYNRILTTDEITALWNGGAGAVL